jgi:hypothetical protein
MEREGSCCCFCEGYFCGVTTALISGGGCSEFVECFILSGVVVERWFAFTLIFKAPAVEALLKDVLLIGEPPVLVIVFAFDPASAADNADPSRETVSSSLKKKRHIIDGIVARSPMKNTIVNVCCPQSLPVIQNSTIAPTGPDILAS